jgi:hypothetical protein
MMVPPPPKYASGRDSGVGPTVASGEWGSWQKHPRPGVALKKAGQFESLIHPTLIPVTHRFPAGVTLPLDPNNLTYVY